MIEIDKPYEQTQAELDTKRREAFHSGDNRAYAMFCLDLGIEPEDQERYERGIIELQLARRSQGKKANSIESRMIRAQQTREQKQEPEHPKISGFRD